MTEKITIKLAENLKDMDACMALRWSVFVQEQKVPETEERDGEDLKCKHVLAQIDGVSVGAARFQPIDDYMKIQRVCILKQHRGKDIGAEIIRFIESYVRDKTDKHKLKLGSQTHAIGFYEKLGFEVYGTEYVDAGIPHRDMVLEV